jgi:hypothetical protein
MSGNPALRSELDAASKLRVSSEYRERLQALQSEFGHSISILADGHGRIGRFNCFAYALGLWNHDTYTMHVDRDGSSAIVNSEFVQRMMKDSELGEIEASKAQAGDMIVYFHKDRATHAGVVASAGDAMSLHSKWGGNEVHQHGIWEVPAAYGDRVRFFRRPDIDVSLSRLRATPGMRNAAGCEA